MAHIWRVVPELKAADHQQAAFYARQGNTVIVHEHRHDDSCVPENGAHTCHDACTGRGHWRYQLTEATEIDHDEAKLWLSGVILPRGTARKAGT